jgi:hypothetical protein
MLVGYVRVSKATVARLLRRSAMYTIAAGIQPSGIYEDLASGRGMIDQG